jgi:regulator of protease activity HflC (stomatin/prohibitin superfamily)
MVRLRAFGSYAIAVSNPMLFVTKVVGGQGIYTTPGVTNYLRGIIVSSLADLLGKNMKSIFDLPGLYDEIAAGTRARVQDAFASLGLELRALNVQAITPPEDVQKAIDQRSGMGAIGVNNMTAYLQYQAAQAMREAARMLGEGSGRQQEPSGVGQTAGSSLEIMRRDGRVPEPSLDAILEFPGRVAQALNRMIPVEALPAGKRRQGLAALLRCARQNKLIPPHVHAMVEVVRSVGQLAAHKPEGLLVLEKVAAWACFEGFCGWAWQQGFEVP